MTTTSETSVDTSPPSAGMLAGKVAFISGAGRGIGAAAARLFAREGAQVLLTARTADQLRTVTEEVRAAGGTAEYVISDLADPASVRAAVQSTAERFGRLDVAFNNGAAITPPAAFNEVPEADFDLLYQVNLKGLWVAMSAQIAAIRDTSGTGSIVNNSSSAASWAIPSFLRTVP